MALTDYLLLQAAPLYVAVVLMLALAAGLLYVDFNRRVNRAFAVFLVLRAGGMLLATVASLAFVAGDTAFSSYLNRVEGYFFVAAFLAFVHFLVVYPRQRRFTRIRGFTTAAFAALAVVMLAPYARDKCWWVCETGAGAIALGPWAALSLLLVAGVAGLLFLAESTRVAAGPTRRALTIVGAVFTWNALFDGVRGAFDYALVRDGGAAALGLAPSLWTTLNLVSTPLALVPAAAALVVAARADLPARTRRVVLGGAAVAVATGVYVGVASRGFLADNAGLFVLGAWRIALPLGVSYAILRHQLFDLDVKLKWTLSRGSIAAVFGGAFFVGSELLEGLFPGDGVLVGIAFAALVTFALRPLRRVADGFAARLLPDAVATPDAERVRKLDVYRAAVESAVETGGIDARERAVLDRLRQKLNLAELDARGVEAAAQ